MIRSRKVLCFLCCLLYLFPTYSQRPLIVTVVEAATHRPLPFANVFLQQQLTGDATNFSGVVVLSPDRMKFPNDTLICSFVGFQEKRLPLATIKKDSLRIVLEPMILNLQTAEIRAQVNPLSALDVVKRAIKATKSNYPDQARNFKAFYQEKLLERDTCVFINEALVEFHYTKYPQKNFVKKSWRKFWDDSFENQRKSSKVCEKYIIPGFPQFFKYYNTVKDQCRITACRRSENWARESIKPIINGGPLALTAADKVKYQTDFLDPKLLDKYNYEKAGAVELRDRLCVVIRFQPKMMVKQLHQLWNKKMTFPIYAGALYIDLETYAVVRIESQFAPNARTEMYMITEPWANFPKVNKLIIDYTIQEGKWFLSEIVNEQFFPGNSSFKWPFDHDYTCIRRLQCLAADVMPANAFAEDDPELLPDIQDAKLQSVYRPYRPADWEEIDSFLHHPGLSVEEQQQLEQAKTLEAQFMAVGEG